MNQKAAVPYAGSIDVAPGMPPYMLHKFQQEAIKNLDQKALGANNFAGLLVIPTGGGKTLVAVHWLLKNVINNNQKVLWIAHRHELLEQAYFTVTRCSYSTVLPNREEKSFRFRIISGLHDKPVNLKKEDDFVIASKDSLNHGLNYLEDKWLRYSDKVFLVIDEAHHAVAKTYRKVIRVVKGTGKSRVKILGLTATPFRTAENEQGLLGKIFQSNVVYKVDSSQLIAQGILSKPVIEEPQTHIAPAEPLTTKDIQKIKNLDQLPPKIIHQIVKDKKRNKLIVSHYINNWQKFGQLLVFAVSRIHAITLNKLFSAELNRLFGTKNKTYSEYVISGEQTGIGVTISPEENKLKIQEFRTGKIKVLINVNIVTEGTDLPNVHTVFLTRPTTSTILMTQMVGRALRGPKAGGTSEAYIVSFVDDWSEKINWVSPRRIAIWGEFTDGKQVTQKQIAQFISLRKIEEFAMMMHRQIPQLEALEFLERIPIGVYSFSLLGKPAKNDDSLEKDCFILVYNHLQRAFQDFIDGIEPLFVDKGLSDEEYLSDEELDELLNIVGDEYFSGQDLSFGYQNEDIKDILRFYAQTGEAPMLLRFQDRKKCDLTREARYIYDRSLGGKAKTDYEDKRWNENEWWKVLFDHNKEFFIRQLNIELERIARPKLRKREEAQIQFDQVDLVDLSMQQIRDKSPSYWRQLRDKVFARHTDGNGLITCAISGYKSEHRRDFHIDHIVPRSKGGKTTIDNLQILKREVNLRKGTKLEYTPKISQHNLQPESRAYCIPCNKSQIMSNPHQIEPSSNVWEGVCPDCGATLKYTARNQEIEHPVNKQKRQQAATGKSKNRNTNRSKSKRSKK